MYKLYCRIVQFGLKITNYFVGYHTPVCIKGEGSIKKLPALISSHKVKKVLVVAGKHIHSNGLTKDLIEGLKKEGIEYEIFTDLQANPTDENVYAGYEIYKSKRCEGIIAFGGGSPMDCSKAIAAINARPNKKISELQGILKVRKKICPFYAVPTTSGTGSETTIAAVITEAKTHHKASINDPCILPRYAVLDPSLTIGLPPQITSMTGMDALCHAVEAYTNHAYNTKEENQRAKNAVKLIYENILDAYNDGNNKIARENMQIAAFDAGRAFTRGCVGYVHAVGHTLSGLYGLPHGLVMAIILPKVLRQFGSSVYKRLAELADVCGIKGNNNEEKALNFISWIEDTNEAMKIPKGFDCIKKEDIDQIILWAMKEANPVYPVPKIWLKEDFEKLLSQLEL